MITRPLPLESRTQRVHGRRPHLLLTLVAVASMSVAGVTVSALGTPPVQASVGGVQTVRLAAAGVTPTAPTLDERRPLLTPRTFADPPASVRPGTRWWWDSLVNTGPGFSLPDALAEVDAMAAAGFGRFEIAWAPGTYGTPAQQADLAAVANRARTHGMQVDMTLGPGWPWATPGTTGDLGQQELMYGRTEVSGPTTYDGNVAPAIGDSSPRGRLVAVTAARVVKAGPAVTQAGTPPAESTVLAAGSLVDLTRFVEGQRLRWKVPAGEWIIFSFWQRNRDGNFVSLISERSVRKGLEYIDANQLGAARDEVEQVGHSFFEDSLELNAEELYWTPTLPAEFAARRGYAMAKYLPLMFAQGVSDYWVPQDEPVPDFDLAGGEGSRYRQDYYRTITDLYLDNHVKVVGQWARKYGMRFRTQPAYGNNFDVVRSAREAARAGVLVDDESLNAGDTPFFNSASETPGVPNEEFFSQPNHPYWHFAFDHYRQVTSGAHQGGATEVTSELGAWFGRELATSWREYKRMMDKEWAAGITRPLLHGMTHSPTGTAWPGAAHFLALVGESVNHRTWPQWRQMKPLADYWGRGALVLQQGRALSDVAILRDNFVTTAAGGDVVRPLYDTTLLGRRGYNVGYLDSTGLAQAGQSRRGELFPTGPSYDAVVVDPSLLYVGGRRLAGDAAQALDRASAKGLRVVFVGSLPRQGLGGLRRLAEDATVRGAVASIVARPTTARVASPGQVAGALARLGAQPAAQLGGTRPVYTQLRATADGTRYFYLWNATGVRQRFSGSFAAKGAPTELDLWTGKLRPLAQWASNGRRVRVPVDLPPHGTSVLMFKPGTGRLHVTASTADEVRFLNNDRLEVRDRIGGPQKVRFAGGRTATVWLPVVSDEPIVVGDELGEWTLQVKTYGPEGIVDRPTLPLLGGLADWRTIPGLTTESGVGTYRTTVQVPERWVGSRRAVNLDVGEFEGTVQVFVNGRRVTPEVDPQEPLDVTPLLRAGENVVQIVLATTPFNKAVATPTTLITRPGFPVSLVHLTQSYGLLGPVRLLPSARGTVTAR